MKEINMSEHTCTIPLLDETQKDKLGDRMKSYENTKRDYLDTKQPIILRLDRKSISYTY